jgi:hypothetical protein
MIIGLDGDLADGAIPVARPGRANALPVMV